MDDQNLGAKSYRCSISRCPTSEISPCRCRPQECCVSKGSGHRMGCLGTLYGQAHTCPPAWSRGAEGVPVGRDQGREQGRVKWHTWGVIWEGVHHLCPLDPCAHFHCKPLLLCWTFDPCPLSAPHVPTWCAVPLVQPSRAHQLTTSPSSALHSAARSRPPSRCVKSASSS